MSNAHERGFTLIEMLTVVGIVIILTGILFANFRNYGSTARLEEDVSELVSLIRSARQDSISVRQYGAIYPSYGIYVQTAAPAGRIASQAFVYTDKDTTDTIYFFNKLMPEANDKGNNIVQNIALSPGVTVTGITFKPASGANQSPAIASILFVRPDPIIYITKEEPANTQVILGSGTLEIRLGLGAEVRSVCINSSGHIRTGQATCL